MSISAEGSVNGKKLGRKRDFPEPKKRWAKRLSVALRSTKLMPSSTQSPSICWNAGACDGSNGSLRYALPGISTRIGGGYFWSVRVWTGDVCVRRTTSSDRKTVSCASRAGWFAGKFSDPKLYQCD